MPLYEDKCEACGHVQEEIRKVADPAPTHCGQPMARQLGTCAIARRTKGGNLIHSATTGSAMKGNRRPKTIGRGHGLGGRRPNPTMKQVVAAKNAQRGLKP